MKDEDFHKINACLFELAERTEKVTFIYEPESGRLIYLSPAFEEVWRKTRESVVEDPTYLTQVIHPDDRTYLVQAYYKLLNNGNEEILEFRIQFPHEKLKWIRLMPHVLDKSSENKVIVGFAEDITVTKEHTNTLHKYAARKDSVLEILSHDLAGPLTTSRTFASMMAERLKTYNDPELDHLLHKISATNERSIRMIRELVKQEFLESSHSELIRKRIDITKVIRQVVDQYKSSEQDIQKKFIIHTSGEDIYADVDDFKFSQIINNLISNAIKFTHDDGTISVGLEEKETSILITVADDGIGIPAHLQNNLFEKFTKARRPGLRGEPSVGLGMSIIKTIVEWHQGTISFESEEGKGTTFFIELPHVASEE